MFAKFERENFFVAPFKRGVLLPGARNPASFNENLSRSIAQLESQREFIWVLIERYFEIDMPYKILAILFNIFLPKTKIKVFFENL